MNNKITCRSREAREAMRTSTTLSIEVLMIGSILSVTLSCLCLPAQLRAAEAKPLLALQTKHNSGINCVSMSPDKRFALTVNSGGRPKLWDIATRSVLRELKYDAQDIVTVGFSDDSKLAITGALDNTARIWNLADGEQIKIIRVYGQTVPQGYSSVVLFASFLQRNRVLTVSLDGNVVVWNSNNYLEERRMTGPSRISSVDLSPDWSTIAVAYQSNEIWLWNVEGAWLQYGVDRVPGLFDDIEAGRIVRRSFETREERRKGLTLSDNTGIAVQLSPAGTSSLDKPGAFQQPTLFDFRRATSTAMLKVGGQ